jgi:hypothetical protein
MARPINHPSSQDEELEESMQERCHRRYRISQIILLIHLSIALRFVSAQDAPPPALDRILPQLEINLSRYDKQVPDFFCSEHVISSLAYGKKRQSTITDSVFRVARSVSGTLTESREIKAINGTSTNGNKLGGPVVLEGVFSGGLDAVSLRQKACMSYTLQPIEHGRQNAPYVIQFTTQPDARHRSECVLKEEGTGRVFVDPATMQVTRMELIAPNHHINSAEAGTWHISIDYAPTVLAGQTFWMPTTITSTETPVNVYTSTVYSFSATYTDYHKLEVTSHIVPSR